MAQSWLTVYLLGSFGDGFLPVLVQIESDLDAILSEIAGSAFHSNANLRNFSRHVALNFSTLYAPSQMATAESFCEVVRFSLEMTRLRAVLSGAQKRISYAVCRAWVRS
jgi:Mg2+ and Co2+ transporter CorA